MKLWREKGVILEILIEKKLQQLGAAASWEFLDFGNLVLRGMQNSDLIN